MTCLKRSIKNLATFSQGQAHKEPSRVSFPQAFEQIWECVYIYTTPNWLTLPMCDKTPFWVFLCVFITSSYQPESFISHSNWICFWCLNIPSCSTHWKLYNELMTLLERLLVWPENSKKSASWFSSKTEFQQ